MVDLVDVHNKDISPSHCSIVDTELDTTSVSLSLNENASINATDNPISSDDDNDNKLIIADSTNLRLDTPEHISVESTLDTLEHDVDKCHVTENTIHDNPANAPQAISDLMKQSPISHDDKSEQLSLDPVSHCDSFQVDNFNFTSSNHDINTSESICNHVPTVDSSIQISTSNAPSADDMCTLNTAKHVPGSDQNISKHCNPTLNENPTSPNDVIDDHSCITSYTPVTSFSSIKVNDPPSNSLSGTHQSTVCQSLEDVSNDASNSIAHGSIQPNVSFDELTDDSVTGTFQSVEADDAQEAEEEEEEELRIKLEKRQNVLESLKKKELLAITQNKSKLNSKKYPTPSFEEGECSSSAIESSIYSSDSDSSDLDNCDRCPICLTSLSKCKELGTPESCDHCFCLECLIEWSKKVNTCPVDRHTFNLIFVRWTIGGDIISRLNVKECNTFAFSADSAVEDELTFCQVCNLANREDCLLLCDGCDAGYHYYCLTPALDGIPANDWFCPSCRVQRNLNSIQESIEDELNNAPVTMAVPRTLQSQRVRAAIERVRMNRILSSSSSVDDKQPKPMFKAKSRKISSRKSKKRKSKKHSSIKRKNKKHSKRKPSTVKSRLANALGITKPRQGQTIPRSNNPADTAKEKAILILRGELASSSHSLCVMANHNTLDPSFSDSENKPGQIKLSQAAQKYRMPIKSSNDILGDILACQKNLHTNFDIEKDGKVKQNEKKNISSEKKKEVSLKKKNNEKSLEIFPLAKSPEKEIEQVAKTLSLQSNRYTSRKYRSSHNHKDEDENEGNQDVVSSSVCSKRNSIRYTSSQATSNCTSSTTKTQESASCRVDSSSSAKTRKSPKHSDSTQKHAKKYNQSKIRSSKRSRSRSRKRSHSRSRKRSHSRTRKRSHSRTRKRSHSRTRTLTSQKSRRSPNHLSRRSPRRSRTPIKRLSRSSKRSYRNSRSPKESSRTSSHNSHLYSSDSYHSKQFGYSRYDRRNESPEISSAIKSSKCRQFNKGTLKDVMKDKFNHCNKCYHGSNEPCKHYKSKKKNKHYNTNTFSNCIIIDDNTSDGYSSDCMIVDVSYRPEYTPSKRHKRKPKTNKIKNVHTSDIYKVKKCKIHKKRPTCKKDLKIVKKLKSVFTKENSLNFTNDALGNSDSKQTENNTNFTNIFNNNNKCNKQVSNDNKSLNNYNTVIEDIFAGDGNDDVEVNHNDLNDDDNNNIFNNKYLGTLKEKVKNNNDDDDDDNNNIFKNKKYLGKKKVEEKEYNTIFNTDFNKYSIFSSNCIKPFENSSDHLTTLSFEHKISNNIISKSNKSRIFNHDNFKETFEQRLDKGNIAKHFGIDKSKVPIINDDCDIYNTVITNDNRIKSMNNIEVTESQELTHAYEHDAECERKYDKEKINNDILRATLFSSCKPYPLKKISLKKKSTYKYGSIVRRKKSLNNDNDDVRGGGDFVDDKDVYKAGVSDDDVDHSISSLNSIDRNSTIFEIIKEPNGIRTDKNNSTFRKGDNDVIVIDSPSEDDSKVKNQNSKTSKSDSSDNHKEKISSNDHTHIPLIHEPSQVNMDEIQIKSVSTTAHDTGYEAENNDDLLTPTSEDTSPRNSELGPLTKIAKDRCLSPLPCGSSAVISVIKKKRLQQKERNNKITTDINIFENVSNGEVDTTKKLTRDQQMSKHILKGRVIEEIKMALKPFYMDKIIDKVEYKSIMRKAVPKVQASDSVNILKIRRLIQAYVDNTKLLKDRIIYEQKKKLKKK